MSGRYQAGIWIGVILAINLMSVAALQPHQTIALGYFVGSLSANATLAAAWCALGPAPLIWRLPMSIGWILVQLVVVALNITFNGGPSNGVFVIGVLLMVQYLLLQLPLWAFRWGFGWKLQHRDESITAGQSSQVRFGIRDLFILMTIVGVLLAIGRLLFPFLQGLGGAEVIIFVLLGVAGVIMTFPLLIATLMERMTLPGIAAACVFIAAATLAETPLFGQLGGPGPDLSDFVAINTASALLVLIVAGIMRLNGYSLQRAFNIASSANSEGSGTLDWGDF